MNRLRNRLIVVFLVATLAPLAGYGLDFRVALPRAR